MTNFDLSAPATLGWTSKDVPHERPKTSLQEAVRFAMEMLTRTEFFSAHVTTNDDVFSGDEIAEIFQTGRLARRRYAAF